MDNLIGRTLDGLYAVRELIGTGGMANVYKAVVVGENGPVPVGTVVAVKVLRQELMHDPDLVRRFKNESKAISLLNHPNIVKVYDVSVSETLQYIVNCVFNSNWFVRISRFSSSMERFNVCRISFADFSASSMISWILPRASSVYITDAA